MPDLGADGAACLVHLACDLLPSIERVAVEERYLRLVMRCGAIDHGAFGQDEAYASFGAAIHHGVSTLRPVTADAFLAAALGVDEGAPINFTFAFLTVGLVSLASVLQMRKLAPDAGAEMAGRAEAGQEVAEPKAESRPQA